MQTQFFLDIRSDKQLEEFVQKSKFFKEAFQIFLQKLELSIVFSISNFELNRIFQYIRFYQYFNHKLRNNIMQLIFQGILLNLQKQRKISTSFLYKRNINAFVKQFNEILKSDMSFACLSNGQLQGISFFCPLLEPSKGISTQLIYGMIRGIVAWFYENQTRLDYLKNVRSIKEREEQNNNLSFLRSFSLIGQIEQQVIMTHQFIERDQIRGQFKQERDFSFKYLNDMINNLRVQAAFDESRIVTDFGKVKQLSEIQVLISLQLALQLIHKHYSKLLKIDSEDKKMQLIQALYCEISVLLDQVLFFDSHSNIFIKRFEIELRRFRSKATKYLKKQYIKSMDKLIQKQFVKQSYKPLASFDDEKFVLSKYAIDIGGEFKNWRTLHDNDYDIFQDKLKYYQQELIMLRLLRVIKEQKIKLDVNSSIVVAFDINHIIDCIKESELAKDDVHFLSRLNSLDELQKWKNFFNEVVEGQLQPQRYNIEEESKIDEDFEQIKKNPKPKKNETSHVRIKPQTSVQISQKIKDSITFMKE
ncbi:UNKNOWN [Stylonychia lemnae]|uniref:Uncharacterized protein n=1 Tax=Stylonychia lemnae TaxID=5949 RepID=A0A078AGP2_STYLE|nr:UNKNOWN [Stylonychia lemnae]|eukprot:CDW80702.1 UNKNOWN [Stylonychia lemnae]